MYAPRLKAAAFCGACPGRGRRLFPARRPPAFLVGFSVRVKRNRLFLRLFFGKTVPLQLTARLSASFS
ncbi:MAG TPA: hypothetical protein DC013_07660 [Ruminococcaceae bacterium]|nr:hypothetical protein [Oscillospiraceae bacterium]